MLAGVVREVARRHPDHPVLIEPDGTPTTAADLNRRSEGFAQYLLAKGIRPGDRIVLRLPSDANYVTAYVGAAKAGAVTVGVNPRLAPVEQAALTDLVEPALVIDAPAAVELHRGNRPLPYYDPDRPITIVFTSGTSGLPKGAVFCGRHLSAVVAMDVPGALHAQTGQPMFVSTQMAHVGFMTKLPWYIGTRSTQYLVPKWRADDIIDLVERHRIAVIGGVAAQIALLLRSPRLATADLDCVSLLIVGGAASPPALIRQACTQLGCSYSVRYSSTECGGIGLANTIAAADLDRLDDRALAAVGQPRPGVDIRVVGDDGADAPPGQPGELWLRSPAVMAGYFANRASTASAITKDGWLRAGDLAEADEEGTVWLAGRRSDMYIRGGYNVFPNEVEAVLAAHPSVAEIAIVAVPDDVMGEIGVAVVVPHGRGEPDLAELRRFAADRLASYKLPERVECVDALPLTAMQKLDRRALADRFGPTAG